MYNPFTWFSDKDFKTARIKGKAFIQGQDDHLVDPNDVDQGAIGDCWLMASMAAIAKTNPQAIERLIKVRDQKQGLYDVTIYTKKNGRRIPTVITVSDRFPNKTDGQKPPRADLKKENRDLQSPRGIGRFILV